MMKRTIELDDFEILKVITALQRLRDEAKKQSEGSDDFVGRLRKQELSEDCNEIIGKMYAAIGYIE